MGRGREGDLLGHETCAEGVGSVYAEVADLGCLGCSHDGEDTASWTC